ncbi:restriction endonuclease subunit S [Faecalibacterium sp. I3-3-33]|uniref:restriction endonuclease subunit S n=1 Tax=Faecalibacterium sp. I3-3-33 TaxID=2929492 RepID=UPI002014E5CC|nr:restriction endonuclease subunit S [Faecalibacterium sp. I3-3-33]UQK45860.1 restriction endonuclease subunit S [Faecalibacterium sp. I3-3-33]
MAKLGDIATYINGYAFKPQDWSDEGIPIIRIQDLTGNSYQANRYNGEYASKYEVNDGDVLISWSASLGVYIWHGEKAVLNQHIFKVVFDKERISKDFFVHQVGLILENAASDAHGATMKHLTKPVFDALPFYLPPYEKQCEIAEVLDKVTSLISLRKQQLAKLDELVKARFAEMFGDPVSNPLNWPTAELGKRCEIITGNTPSRAEPENYGTFIEWIKSDNINTPSTFLTEAQERLSEIGFQKCRFVESGSLLMTCIAGSLNCIGNVAVANRRVAFNQQINAITPTHDNVLYLYWLMILSKPTIHRTINMALKGILSKSQLSSIKFPFPPLSLQNQFAAFVERVDQQKQTVQQSLEKLELMKKALMQEYFG